MSDSTESKFEAAAEVAPASPAVAEAATGATPEPVEVLEIPALAESAAKSKPASAKRAATVKPAPAKAKAPKPVRKPAAPAKKAVSPKVAAKPAKPAPKPTAIKAVPSKPEITSTRKESIMAKNAKIADGIKETVANAQVKAKKAVEKGTVLLGEAREFSKGNVDAVVESGKILASGIQAMGKEFAADSRSTFELVTGEVKELAAVKTPTDFLKVQGDIARKNLDTAISLSSKNAESMLKLASATFAPLSGRFSLAAEKVRKIAA